MIRTTYLLVFNALGKEDHYFQKAHTGDSAVYAYDAVKRKVEDLREGFWCVEMRHTPVLVGKFRVYVGHFVRRRSGLHGGIDDGCGGPR